MASFKRGQKVLVVSEEPQEEGVVLKVGCTWDSPRGKGDSREDGVLVQIDESCARGIYRPDDLRLVDNEGRPARSSRFPAIESSKKKPSRRSSVTPSPSTAPTSTASAKDTDDEQSDREEKEPAAKRNQSQKVDVLTISEESPYFCRIKPSPSKSAKPVTKAKAKRKQKAVQLVVASESESDEDPDDKPFLVEYSRTSRSTCRRCDQAIRKGTVRVSHVPLFRGKPGFRVYRHLDCAIFSEEIRSLEDVGGYRKMNNKDKQALALRIEESLLELAEENKEIQPDELVPVAFEGEARGPPKGLTAALLPFQTEGVSWMYHQEVHVPDVRGGVLADEMGMGKTVQTITTILDNRPRLQLTRPGVKHPPSSPDLEERAKEDQLWSNAAQEWEYEMTMINVPKKRWPKELSKARAGTLVVCPVIALSQWKAEIEKFTEGNALTVGIYHGPNRTSELPAEMMQKYDVVLTTYQVLEQDFRKMVSPNKVCCPNCGGKFKIDKLRVHLKYFCGEGARRTEAQARQRRTADRQHRGGGGSGSSRPASSGKAFKRPPTTQLKGEAPAKRKTLRVKRVAGYDSDSELSVESVELVASTPGLRPSRSAAVNAAKRVSETAKQHVDDEDDEDAYQDEEEQEESEEESVSESDEPRDTGEPSDAKSSRESSSSSEDEKMANLSTKKKATAAGPKNGAAHRGGPLERARARQQEAWAQATRNKGGRITSMTPMPTIGSAAKKPVAKNGGKAKKFDSESDSSSDESSSANPMEGIDMNALMEAAMAGAHFSVLHAFCWWRIVLDEAHFIKSRSSQTAAAAFSLTAIYRWALSGTPLQNRVGELYSLIRFLRIDPMAHYFCRQKGCNCKSIHYRMKNGLCQGCGHRPFTHYAHFNKHVLNPIQRDGYTGDGRRAMFKLKDEVLDKCLLRRTKETRAEDMNLPPRIVTIRPIRLHPVEQDFYNALYTQTKSSFDDYVAEGTLLNNYAHIFDLLTKMRQAVNHPYLIVYSKKNTDKFRSAGSVPVANGRIDCDMCHEPPTDRVVSSCCGAGFCRGCVIDYLTGAVGDNTPCPSCQALFTIDLNQAVSDITVDEGTLTVPTSMALDTTAMPSLKEMSHVATGSILRRITLAEFATSTKIEALVQELVEMRRKFPGNKALVFSQFVNMLDLVRWRLHSDPCLGELGLGVRILHGGMDVKSRDAALKDFREDPSCRVLLMSLKAAGVALNLTVASHAYLLDLWWNPAAEMQAIDRTHRLGQFKPIHAVRFVAEGTVEERVLQLQEKKRLVFDGTIGRDAGSLKMLTVNDMVSLFA